jgi:hypothetical protein
MRSCIDLDEIKRFPCLNCETVGTRVTRITICGCEAVNCLSKDTGTRGFTCSSWSVKKKITVCIVATHYFGFENMCDVILFDQFIKRLWAVFEVECHGSMREEVRWSLVSMMWSAIVPCVSTTILVKCIEVGSEKYGGGDAGRNRFFCRLRDACIEDVYIHSGVVISSTVSISNRRKYVVMRETRL